MCEITADMAVFTLDAAQRRQQGALEPVLLRVRQAAGNAALQVTVQIRVWIEFGA